MWWLLTKPPLALCLSLIMGGETARKECLRWAVIIREQYYIIIIREQYFSHLLCCQGLLVALQNASPKSLVVVFTDNGSKDLNLESEIIRLRKAKECEVFIVLTPAYEGKFNGPSLPSYGRMGKVFLINEVGADSFLRDVEVFEETNCIWTTSEILLNPDTFCNYGH